MMSCAHSTSARKERSSSPLSGGSGRGAASSMVLLEGGRWTGGPARRPGRAAVELLLLARLALQAELVDLVRGPLAQAVHLGADFRVLGAQTGQPPLPRRERQPLRLVEPPHVHVG